MAAMLARRRTLMPARNHESKSYELYKKDDDRSIGVNETVQQQQTMHMNRPHSWVCAAMPSVSYTYQAHITASAVLQASQTQSTENQQSSTQHKNCLSWFSGKQRLTLSMSTGALLLVEQVLETHNLGP